MPSFLTNVNLYSDATDIRSVPVDSVIKRLMITAVNYSIGGANQYVLLKGMIGLKRGLQVSSSDDFRVGMICGEAYARAAVMLRMYAGREPTKEESELMIAMLTERCDDIRDSLLKGR